MPTDPHADRTSFEAPGSPSPLIEVPELADALQSGTPPVILDVRWSLTGDGYDDFLAGHIPGAQFADLDRDLAQPPGSGGRHPLPTPGMLEALFARTGVTPGRSVVVTGQRDTSIAARAWWLLRWAGHDEVRVLDGGFQAWAAAGLPTQSGPTSGSPAVHVPAVRTGAMPTVDADGAAALAGGAASGSVLLDARAAERYRGEVEPVDPVPGHIPGAVNLPLAEIHRPDGTLLPAGELRGVFAAAGVTDGVRAAASCGSGVTACSLILAADIAGRRLALYPGSYSGWCALGRPVEAG